MIFLGPNKVQNMQGLQATYESITVTWDELNCTERNRAPFQYSILYENNTETTHATNYIAEGLEPNTTYKFQVAGTNINGTGMYASIFYTTLPSGECIKKIDTL